MLLMTNNLEHLKIQLQAAEKSAEESQRVLEKEKDNNKMLVRANIEMKEKV